MSSKSSVRKSSATDAGAATTNGTARQRAAAGRANPNDDLDMSPMSRTTELPASSSGSDYGRKISWSPDIPQVPNPKVKVSDYVPSNGTRRRSSLQIGTSTTIRSGWIGSLVRRKQKLQLELRKRGWNLSRVLFRTLAAVVAIMLLVRYFAHGDRAHSGPRKLAPAPGKYVDETESWAGHAPEGGSHRFGSDGWLRSTVAKHGKGGRHPIWDLMEDADHKYDTMAHHQPKSLKGLVMQYKDIYGRPPPLHFELLAPHLVASMPYSPLASPSAFHMYLSMTPTDLHERHEAAELSYDTLEFHHDEPFDAGKLVIEFRAGRPHINWPWNAKKHNGLNVPGNDAGLHERLERWLMRAEWRDVLPDLKLTVNMEELNPQVIPAEYKEAAIQLAKKGQIERDQVEGRLRAHDSTWAIGCSANSALVKGQPGIFGAALGRGHGIYTPAFIHSPPKAASYCLHPALAPLSPAIALQPEPVDVHTRPVPQIASRTGLSGLASDILVLGIGNPPRTGAALGEVPWEHKHGQSVFWRGPSPDFDDPLAPLNAKLSSALRLALLSSTPIDSFSFPSTLIAPLNVVDTSIVPKSARKHGKKHYNFKVDTEERISSDLWNRGNFLDVAFTDYSLPCDGLPGCEGLNKRVRFDNEWRNRSRQKFVMVLDDEDPRDAFEAGSLVLYASTTGMSAWQTKAIPWRDYIPVSPDFSDLPSILSFLRANDDQAARIAGNGRSFALKVLSEDAYDASLLGALLEWSRVWNDTRSRMNIDPASY